LSASTSKPPATASATPFNVAIPVADPGRANCLERRGGKLLGGRRRVVDAPIDDERLPEGRNQIGTHRVGPPEGCVLEEDDIDHGIEQRVRALRLAAVVVGDAGGEDRIVLRLCVEGPEVVVHAQVPRHPLAGLVDLRGRELIGRGDGQLELGVLGCSKGDDVDLHQPSGGQANDLDEPQALSHLRRDDVVAQLETEVVRSGDLGCVDRDLRAEQPGRLRGSVVGHSVITVLPSGRLCAKAAGASSSETRVRARAGRVS
jgi:hypothetical protein